MSIRDTIAQTGAVLEGDYFIALKSRRITQKYINMDSVFTRPELVDVIGSMLVSKFASDCNAVVAPAVAGIPLVYAAARSLRIGNMSLDLRTAFAEKQPDGSFMFERMGFMEALGGRDVLVVEDVTTTGESTLSVIDLVRAAGGTVIGASFVWNRGSVDAEMLGVPIVQNIVAEPTESWEPHEHPQWGELPLVQDIGHPEHYPDYPGPSMRLLAA